MAILFLFYEIILAAILPFGLNGKGYRPSSGQGWGYRPSSLNGRTSSLHSEWMNIFSPTKSNEFFWLGVLAQTVISIAISWKLTKDFLFRISCCNKYIVCCAGDTEERICCTLENASEYIGLQWVCNIRGFLIKNSLIIMVFVVLGIVVP